MTDLDVVLEKWKGLVGKSVKISGLTVTGIFKVLEVGKYGVVLENKKFGDETSTGHVRRITLEKARWCKAVLCE